MNRPAALRAVLLSVIALTAFSTLASEPTPASATPPLELKVPTGFSVELVAGRR